MADVVADRDSWTVLLGEMSKVTDESALGVLSDSTWALAHNTFREAVRDKVLYSILSFAVGVIALSLVMQEITVGDEKVVRSVAQGAVAAFGSIISMFLGISLVWKEVERKTVYHPEQADQPVDVRAG